MKKIFAYGTLKKGFYNHRLMVNARFINTLNIPGYTLYDVGYPLAVKSKQDDCIEGEVYKIADDVFYYIRDMEEKVGYKTEMFGDIHFFTYDTKMGIHIGSKWGN